MNPPLDVMMTLDVTLFVGDCFLQFEPGEGEYASQVIAIDRVQCSINCFER